jgi:hypothetical protein
LLLCYKGQDRSGRRAKRLLKAPARRAGGGEAPRTRSTRAAPAI